MNKFVKNEDKEGLGKQAYIAIWLIHLESYLANAINRATF